MPAARRKTSSPAPGQPLGNVEKRRCNPSPYEGYAALTFAETLNRGDAAGTLSRGLQFEDSPLQPEGHGMSPVIGAKFGEDVLDVAFDRFLRDRELIGNSFVRISRRNQP